MEDAGLNVACRYSFPPNSLSLCGPSRQKDLHWYTTTLQTDRGTEELLRQFETLYPYLCLIAGQNKKKDPFDLKVVEAYWLGNSLLHKTRTFDFLQHIEEKVRLEKSDRGAVKEKIAHGALPNHAFHVLNIYKRTGHLDIPHSIQTMDACIINSGRIVEINPTKIVVETRPLQLHQGLLEFGSPIRRKLRPQGEKDILVSSLSVGDSISYHWGYICEKLSIRQVTNLYAYTSLALKFANSTHSR